MLIVDEIDSASSMATYFFDLHDRFGHLVDFDGQQCQDLDDAREKAVKSVREILAHDVIRGVLDLSGCLKVRDDANDVVLSVDYHQAVLRVVD